jgi:hypothetical protein
MSSSSIIKMSSFQYYKKYEIVKRIQEKINRKIEEEEESENNDNMIELQFKFDEEILSCDMEII